MDPGSQKCGNKEHHRLNTEEPCGGSTTIQDQGTSDHQSKRLFKNVRQAWRAVSQVREDYKTGRMIRKAQEQPTTSPENHSTRPKDPVCDDGDADPEQVHVRPTGRQGWQGQRGEYPWRIEKTIQGDVNWRGTWILEVKDLFDVTWERRRIHDGRRWRWETIPQGHWPFSPYNNEAHEDRNITNADTKPSKEEKQ